MVDRQTPLPAVALQDGLHFLAQVIRARLAHFLHPAQALTLPEPVFQNDGSPLAEFIVEKRLSIEEYLLLFIALAPHAQPNFYGALIAEQLPSGSELPEFGGVRPNNVRSIVPTGETALFVLGGMSTAERQHGALLLRDEHWLFKKRVLTLDIPHDGEPLYSGKLTIGRDWIERFTLGIVSLPKMSLRFPAQHIATDLSWEDLVLTEQALSHLREIKVWVDYHKKLFEEWGMAKTLKPGYRALFHGPPGTGKTLAATLLGKYTEREVFRVDLATLVSKYIGETEKNLANLFEQAEDKNWILFFDEADAIFGKRTQVRDAHDKYANQEVSYLLQRMETFAGLIILASNFRSNLDDAFVRRFQSIVYFPMPRAAERLSIWKRNFPQVVTLAEDVNLEQIAARYELSGSNIVNIVQYCCLKALAADTNAINQDNLLWGINRELLKEDKAV